ncbi:CYTH domain-containing protein [Lentibacillus lipolyticus]|nr:CYTH domain-containing protein [Lentibacillus lipolyticus]
MTQEIEIEYKNLLTKSEFDRLLTSLPFPEEAKSQTNHYFETKDFSLKRHGCALRIREKEGSFTLTLKEPHSTGLLETHDVLTNEQAASWMNGKPIYAEKTARQLDEKGIYVDELVYYGSLTTHRRELAYGDVLLVLDDNTYSSKTDYELELEAASEKAGQTAMQQLLDQYQIEQRETPNKIQRFFAAKFNDGAAEQSD